MKIKVLSLFDGISVAQQALKELGYDVEYYASEIDKYAIQITQKNHPNTIQLGSVSNLCISEYTKKGTSMYNRVYNADLLIGGSPCQDLSIAKKNRQGLDGARSGLFWEYVRILKEVKPKYFVLENVNSMPKEAKAIITEALGVEPIMINASLVSAQNRKRLFWTNISNVTQPEDRGILLKDILEKEVDEKYNVQGYTVDRLLNNGKGFRSKIDLEKGSTLFASMHKVSRGMDLIRVGQIGKGGQGDRIYSPDGKSVGLSALGGGRGAKTGLYAINNRIGGFTVNERGIRPHRGDKSKTGISELGRILFETSKTDALSTRHQPKILMQEKTDLAKSVSSFPKLPSGTTVQKNGATSSISQDTIIRKLTPIECERLQSLPDNYTEGVSNTQRYKALGNAFNKEVVKHILSSIDLSQ